MAFCKSHRRGACCAMLTVVGAARELCGAASLPPSMRRTLTLASYARTRHPGHDRGTRLQIGRRSRERTLTLCCNLAPEYPSGSSASLLCTTNTELRGKTISIVRQCRKRPIVAGSCCTSPVNCWGDGGQKPWNYRLGRKGLGFPYCRTSVGSADWQLLLSGWTHPSSAYRNWRLAKALDGLQCTNCC